MTKFKSTINCLPTILVIIFSTLVSCNPFDDDEQADRKETVILYVSSETGSAVGLNGESYEYMLVREKGQSSWNTWAFEGIEGFTYEKGYEYELLVTKTIYANPPADGGAYDYVLVSIVSKVLPDDSEN